MIEGIDLCCEVFWIGNEKNRGGVGILSEEWLEKVFNINRVLDCIMIKLAIDNKIIMVLCYAPQVGLDNIIKDIFYDQLQYIVRKVGTDETLVICGDLNSHIGEETMEGEHILEYAVDHNLVVGNLYFTKKDNHLITNQSGGISSQID